MTEEVLKLNKLISVKFIHLENRPIILVTFEVSKDEISIIFKLLHEQNISFMVLTFDVLKLDKFK